MNKGQNSYGEERQIPVLPLGKEFLKRCLESRKLLLKELGLETGAIIPSLVEGVPFASDKTLRKLKDNTHR